MLTNCEDATKETNTNNATFQDFESLVQGRLPSLYATLRSSALYKQQGLLSTWGESGVDTHGGTNNPASYIPLYTYTYNEGSLLIEQTWNEFFWAIKQINTFMGQAKSLATSGDKLELKSVLAEAKFLRALLYFDLVKVWGDVPILLKEGLDISVVREESQIANSPAAEVYLQIIKDLLDAIKDAPEFTESDTRDIASKQAARALLGKVYLQMITTKENGGVEGGIDSSGAIVSIDKRLEQAYEQLSKVVNSGNFRLEDNYEDVFDQANESSNSETIFAIGFTGPNQDVGSDYGDFLGPIGNNQDGGAFGFYRANIDFAFEYLSFDGLVSVNGDDLSKGNVNPSLTDSGSALVSASFPVDQVQDTNNELLARTDAFWADVESFRFQFEQLGVHNFVSDVRFERNIARINANDLGNILRGDRKPTPLESLNLTNVPLTSWSPYKFIKPLPNPNEAGEGLIDFPILRYADILLSLAEVENLRGNGTRAVELMNMVRERAFRENILTLEVVRDSSVSGITYIEPTAEIEGTPQSDINNAIENGFNFSAPFNDERKQNFLYSSSLNDMNEISDAILKERLKELCYEGKRKDDLLRFGKLDEVINQLHENSVNRSVGNQAAVRDNFNLGRHSHWPIPANQIQLNPNLKQNCAYAVGASGCF